MLLTLASLLMVQPPSPAPVAPAPAATAVAASDDDKMVCKSSAQTGTRFKVRTCRTKAEWAAMREQQLRDAAEMVNRPVIETRRE